MMQLRFGTLEGVRFLLDRGANPNLGGLKHTPSASMAEAVELMIRHGWDINERVGGRTLLHHDANHGHVRPYRAAPGQCKRCRNGDDPRPSRSRRQSVRP